MFDTSRDLDAFLAFCQAQVSFDSDHVGRIARETVHHLQNSRSARLRSELSQQLERRWYAALATGTPDYGVYDTADYVADLWACWLMYSRRYLATIQQPGSFNATTSIVTDLQPVEAVADLGCGVGLTTAMLARMFPAATVIGTNLKNTTQWAIASALAVTERFALTETLDAIAPGVDLVFASEYFEHFERPIDHLCDVLMRLQPRALLIANTFSAKSIGHFERYGVGAERLRGTQTSRAFNATLRAWGYRPVRTRLWNQRPAYWRR